MFGESVAAHSCMRQSVQNGRRSMTEWPTQICVGPNEGPPRPVKGDRACSTHRRPATGIVHRCLLGGSRTDGGGRTVHNAPYSLRTGGWLEIGTCLFLLQADRPDPRGIFSQPYVSNELKSCYGRPTGVDRRPRASAAARTRGETANHPRRDPRDFGRSLPVRVLSVLQSLCVL